MADTAAAMGCSQGSVKTRCFRATHALAGGLVDPARCDIVNIMNTTLFNAYWLNT